MPESPVLSGAEPFSAAGGPHGALVLHGFTGSPQSMRGLAQALAGAGFAVELPRLPGHGTSLEDMLATGWTDWSGAAEAAHRELAGRCERVVVVGLSMGGTLTVWLATRHPEIAGIVCVSAGFYPVAGMLGGIALVLWLLVLPASDRAEVADAPVRVEEDGRRARLRRDALCESTVLVAHHRVRDARLRDERLRVHGLRVERHRNAVFAANQLHGFEQRLVLDLQWLELFRWLPGPVEPLIDLLVVQFLKVRFFFLHFRTSRNQKFFPIRRRHDPQAVGGEKEFFAAPFGHGGTIEHTWQRHVRR